LKKIRFRCNSGQATTEYVLLSAVLIMVYLVASQALSDRDIPKKLIEPIKTSFANAYQNGNPIARGYEDPLGPSMHPRIEEDGNFRIFVHPELR